MKFHNCHYNTPGYARNADGFCGDCIDGYNNLNGICCPEGMVNENDACADKCSGTR